MKIVILLSVLLLSGCASNCTSHCVAGFGPGNGLYQAMANHYDGMDPCQKAVKPSFCGASNGKIVHITKGVGNSYIIKQK
jgi:hypothetical protein